MEYVINVIIYRSKDNKLQNEHNKTYIKYIIQAGYKDQRYVRRKSIACSCITKKRVVKD